MSTKQERLIVLGRLSSVLAHEIRNPLAGISAATQMLDGKMDPGDPRKKYAGMILKEVDRVNDIVKNLLDFSREGRAYMVPVRVADLVESALSGFAGPFEQAGIRVATEYGDDVPRAACDTEHMGRVFQNLIANSIDAMPAGGTLTVRAWHDAAGGQVAVSFEDTGEGVEVEDMGELFSPFFTTKAKGNGLGLPVALNFVEEHGGTITARRLEPCGLAMTVRWPVEPPSAAPGAAPS